MNIDEAMVRIKELEGLVDELKTMYDKMDERDSFLCALEAAGVENWDGYDFAQETFGGGQE